MNLLSFSMWGLEKIMIQYMVCQEKKLTSRAPELFKGALKTAHRRGAKDAEEFIFLKSGYTDFRKPLIAFGEQKWQARVTRKSS